MSGEGQLREQAKKQWEKIDAEGCKIINNLLVADKERTVWPENTEPKFTGKKRNKIYQSGIRHKNQEIHAHARGKRSTSGRTNQVRHSRLLHLLQFPSNKK